MKSRCLAWLSGAAEEGANCVMALRVAGRLVTCLAMSLLLGSGVWGAENPIGAGAGSSASGESGFDAVRAADEAARPEVMSAQRRLLEERYDLADRPSGVMMSGGRRPVQQGVRVKLPSGVTWSHLASLSHREIRSRDLWPMGFRPLPHAKHAVGGMVFPSSQIEAIMKLEGRDLARFDVEFDLPDRFAPEFPPPLFLTTRPDLGDVSGGKVINLRNYHPMLKSVLTPVQLEGMRLLLTPFPQQQFNATEDRKAALPSQGVSCFDCHTNGHTNATFHLSPDVRPQSARPRIEAVSLRGEYSQLIHGSKRSLRSIEDFTEFEQRTAYFDGDHVAAAGKGVHLPNRSDQVAMMAQMQNIIDFPPAPKLDVTGRLDRSLASPGELLGEAIFLGKGRCSECHPPPYFLDQKMHDLKVERFHAPAAAGGFDHRATGPIKTFTLRGIKESPPYLHDGRLLTLDDCVEFFNLVLELRLGDEEKQALVAYLLCL